jgi:hypothetical protein
MFGEEKNLKDSVSSQSLTLKDIATPISYTKTNKLISALYMVTDILDKDEPLREKLRILGVQIISDLTYNLTQAERSIYEIVSLLDIASTVGLISDMNRNILKKEFLELDQSIKLYKNPSGKQVSMEDFFYEPEKEKSAPAFTVYHPEPIGHEYGKQSGTRIGVQKGGTLLKALSDKTNIAPVGQKENVPDFNTIKKQRRDDIVNILKGVPDGVTITLLAQTIKDKKVASLSSSGEKTLQRELISMVKDGVLKKAGEKRWSRYFLSK